MKQFLIALIVFSICTIGFAQTGRVGIGTTSPLAPLHVDSTVLFTGNLNLENPALLTITGPGNRLIWHPDKAAFRAGNISPILPTAWDDENIGFYSSAMGISTLASGEGAVAFGFLTSASEGWATAMGTYTSASGYSSTALGNNTTASGYASTAMGTNSVASGYVSTAMGTNASASGYFSTSIGFETDAIGYYSTAMGHFTKAESAYSLAVGNYNKGGGSLTYPPDSDDPVFEIGIGTSETDRRNAMTVYNNAATLWEGEYKSSSPDPPPAIGAGTRMMWYPDKAAFRAGTVAGNHWDQVNIGSYSTALGNTTTASGFISTAMGNFTIASGDYSSAMGDLTTASGDGSTSMGFFTTASGGSSTAMGNNTTASGSSSTSMGIGTKAESYGSLAVGRYNVGGGTPTAPPVSTESVFEIGIGTSSSNPKNAMTVLNNGNTYVNGLVRIENVTYPSAGSGKGLEIAYEPDNHRGIIQAYDRNLSTFGELFLGKGNISIGTDDNYSAMLHIKQVGAGEEALAIENNQNANKWSFEIAAADLEIYYNDVLKASIDYTDGSWDATSDARLKTDIRYMESDILDKINYLKPATYRFIKGDSTLCIGFIAQDVRQVFPELVNDREGEYLRLDYAQFSVYAIKAIQELSAQNQAYDVRVTEQEKKIEAQQQTIDTQQALLQELLQRIEALEQQ